MHWPETNLPMLLGRLLERSETTAATVKELHGNVMRIDKRLADGDRKFEELQAKLEARKPDVGTWERMSIEGTRILIYLVVLWATGSIEQAARLAGMK